jgi:hypothetical protein
VAFCIVPMGNLLFRTEVVMASRRFDRLYAQSFKLGGTSRTDPFSASACSCSLHSFYKHQQMTSFVIRDSSVTFKIQYRHLGKYTELYIVKANCAQRA